MLRDTMIIPLLFLFSFLGTRRLKARCPRAGLPAEAPGEGPSRLSQLLGGSRHPSLGWYPPPSRLCPSLHLAAPLRPRLPSSVSYKDPVPGFRATPIQEDLISDPSLHHSCRDLRFHSEAPRFRSIFAKKGQATVHLGATCLEVQEVRVLDRR